MTNTILTTQFLNLEGTHINHKTGVTKTVSMSVNTDGIKQSISEYGSRINLSQEKQNEILGQCQQATTLNELQYILVSSLFERLVKKYGKRWESVYMSMEDTYQAMLLKCFEKVFIKNYDSFSSIVACVVYGVKDIVRTENIRTKYKHDKPMETWEDYDSIIMKTHTDKITLSSDFCNSIALKIDVQSLLEPKEYKVFKMLKQDMKKKEIDQKTGQRNDRVFKNITSKITNYLNENVTSNFVEVVADKMTIAM